MDSQNWSRFSFLMNWCLLYSQFNENPRNSSLKQNLLLFTIKYDEDDKHASLSVYNFYIQLSEEDDRVRVTDVGVSKHAVDITGTLAGTPIYIAPEVFRSKIYEFSADIYSLGIMLWEMWYGQTAFTNIKCQSLAEFCNLIINEGRRPRHVDKCRLPPPFWLKLMMICWETDPTKRPNAKKCKEILSALYKTL